MKVELCMAVNLSACLPPSPLAAEAELGKQVEVVPVRAWKASGTAGMVLVRYHTDWRSCW